MMDRSSIVGGYENAKPYRGNKNHKGDPVGGLDFGEGGGRFRGGGGGGGAFWGWAKHRIPIFTVRRVNMVITV